MAPSMRKAMGVVKDQTRIGLAIVANNMAPQLEVAIVKATSHDDDPASEKYIKQILSLTSYSRGYVDACLSVVSKRLGKTRDWIVALKALILIHRLMSHGDPMFQQEILYAARAYRGARMLNMSGFKDEAHSNSWDHSAFVRKYALYLAQRLELMLYESKLGGEDINKSVIPLREMKPERIFAKMSLLQRLMDRFLTCRPTGLTKNNRMILVALLPVVKESFYLYTDICQVLALLLDRFFDMEYSDCVKAFEAYVSAAKQIDELVEFHNWYKATGAARSSEFPQIQRIGDKVLETLEDFVRDRQKNIQGPEKRNQETDEESVRDMNEIKTLSALESFTPPPPPEPEPQMTGDLVDLRDDNEQDVNEGNKLALALFGGLSNVEPEVISVWQTPTAEPCKADWELALVESTSNLAKKKADLGSGFDPSLLNGMYDQGIARQYMSVAQLSGGSASSVVLPALGKTKTPVLALPAPDGSVQMVDDDPFAASLTIPPPAYVQMAELEKKQRLLMQEQSVWQQYARDGMQGQSSLAKISGVVAPMMSHGMPT